MTRLLPLWASKGLRSLLLAVGIALLAAPSAQAGWVSLDEKEPTRIHLTAPQDSASGPTLVPAWQVGMYGRGISDQNEQTRAAGAMVLGGFHYHYDELLFAKLSAYAV